MIIYDRFTQKPTIITMRNELPRALGFWAYYGVHPLSCSNALFTKSRPSVVHGFISRNSDTASDATESSVSEGRVLAGSEAPPASAASSDSKSPEAFILRVRRKATSESTPI